MGETQSHCHNPGIGAIMHSIDYSFGNFYHAHLKAIQESQLQKFKLLTCGPFYFGLWVLHNLYIQFLKVFSLLAEDRQEEGNHLIPHIAQVPTILKILINFLDWNIGITSSQLCWNLILRRDPGAWECQGLGCSFPGVAQAAGRSSKCMSRNLNTNFKKQRRKTLKY